MPSIRELFGLSQISAPKEDNVFAMPCNIGVEVELEGYDADFNEANLHYWDVTGDGSLRNNGVEFVFKHPTSGQDIISAIDELQAHLLVVGCQTSHRCSVHVHVDMSEETREVVEKFYLLCMLLEPSLYAMGNKARYDNIYCPGLTHATQQITDAATLFLSDDFVLQRVGEWCKYSGINLACLNRFGTVEVRNHAGTTDISQVLPTIAALIAIKKLATEYTKEYIQKIQSIEELLAGLEGSPVYTSLLTPELMLYFNNTKLNLQYYNLTQLALTEADLGQQPIRYTASQHIRERLVGFQFTLAG
jgi:hypothetical protein